MKRAIIPILFALLAAALVYLWVKVEKPFSPDVPENVPTEYEAKSAEALRIAPAKTYVSYHLVRASGAFSVTGAVWVESEAWRRVTNDQVQDNTRFIRDVIAELQAQQVLDGVDLTKTKSNWLIVLHPGASPRQGWVLDSRDLPQDPKE